ncbi:MAG: FIST C-terminal domain-containing protein [Pseudomonadota bacterium]|nr:FIST C-terminal domain-containing protein [Pseudomonadota bacterium]
MTTEHVAAHTVHADPRAAGKDLAQQINTALSAAPDAIVLFASSSFDYTVLLETLQEQCRPGVLVGASSAGEFTNASRGTGTASALAIRSDDIVVSAGLGTGISGDSRAAAREIVTEFKGMHGKRYPYRAALIMTDALAGHAEEFVEEMTLLTSGRYLLAGGGAGDDANFSRTHVFLGTQIHTNAAVALELLSMKPLGVGVGHGWEPSGTALRATEVEGMTVRGLNGLPAIEAFERHAEATGQVLDHGNPLPFFLHNILGVETGDGYRLRVPLAFDEHGGVHCAAEVPEQARVFIMKTTAASAAVAAARATKAAVEALGDHKPGAAVFFDCVATRLRTGNEFGFELEMVANALAGAPFVGCNTYGQIARSDSQFSGFHNCTAVVLALPT